MDFGKMFQKGGLGLLTFAASYLLSNPQILTHLIPANIGNMTVGAAAAAVIVMAANWVKNWNTPKGAPQVQMQSKLKIFLVLLLSLTGFTGCSTILHPVTGKDIVVQQVNGQSMTCFSDMYLTEVMKVKVGK